jgi:hypothetical protein
VVERRPSGDVQFLEGLDEREPVASAGVTDTLPLLARRDERLALASADSADANYPDRTT